MTQMKSLVPRFAVTDLSRSLDFYRQVLGLEIDFAWPAEAPTFALLKKGALEIGLFVADSQRPGAKVGTLELVLECEDVASVANDLIAQGLRPDWGPEVYSYGRRECAFADPDGHLIIFTEETGDPPTCAQA